MIPLLYAAVVIGQVTQASFMKLNNKTAGGNVVRFSFFKAFSAFLLFLSLFLITREEFHLPTMIYGAVFGVCISCSSFMGYRALGLGPLSLTYMLFNCCIVISCLYGVIFLEESVGLLGGIGFVLVLAAMLLLNFDFSKKKRSVEEKSGAGEGKKPRASLKWLVLVALTLLGDGFCQIAQKAHQNTYPKQYQVGFMMWAMLTWSVIFLTVSLCTGNLKLGRAHLRSDLYAAFSGLSNSLANYFILMLAAMSSATLLFPTISVVTMLVALIAGMILFREKLNLQQIVGFACGVGAVFLLQI